MSKIEEMANKATAYIPENEVLDMDGCAYTTIDEVAKTWYMLGAIAMLEEIEKFIAELPCKSDGELLNQKMLWQRVKQLKEK